MIRGRGEFQLRMGLTPHLFPPPKGVGSEDWRRVGVFFGTIAALMLQPMPGSQVVLVGSVAMLTVGNLPMDRALSGYASSSFLSLVPRVTL